MIPSMVFFPFSIIMSVRSLDHVSHFHSVFHTVGQVCYVLLSPGLRCFRSGVQWGKKEVGGGTSQGSTQINNSVVVTPPETCLLINLCSKPSVERI